MDATCCKCSEWPVAYWPAFDRNVKPAPYCAVHLAEARQNMTLDGPRLIPEKPKYTPALVTV